jgi:hypothetical protein
VIVIGKLHFEGCDGCLFNDPVERCTVDLQEVIDNLHIIEEGKHVCCGCFKESEGRSDD